MLVQTGEMGSWGFPDDLASPVRLGVLARGNGRLPMEGGVDLLRLLRTCPVCTQKEALGIITREAVTLVKSSLGIWGYVRSYHVGFKDDVLAKRTAGKRNPNIPRESCQSGTKANIYLQECLLQYDSE